MILALGTRVQIVLHDRYRGRQGTIVLYDPEGQKYRVDFAVGMYREAFAWFARIELVTLD